MICVLIAATIAMSPQSAPTLRITGDWAIDVSVAGKRVPLGIDSPAIVTVTAEKIDSLPLFNPNAGGWVKGAQLLGVRAQETTTPGLLDPESLVLRSGPSTDSPAFERGRDYEADLLWGTVGRLAGGKIAESQTVYATYRHGLLRLDSIVLSKDGKVQVRHGDPRAAAPLPPALQQGERRLANIWIPGRIERLTEDNLFPVMETVYPEPPLPNPAPAERLLPKTIAKLRVGTPLRILAWGDSVTDAGYLPNPSKDRWQEQVVARLKQRYPKSQIELVTEAWGGRNTGSYLAEPPGSAHNYQERVLGARPDLVISEFVNDAGLNPDQVDERYGKLLADFKSIGAEWIILTPHYVRPDWMGLTRERDIDQDPRAYVAGLRRFAEKQGVALADASPRWGRLWRQGIPYTSLLLNSINHPDARGMKLFADAAIALFPGSSGASSKSTVSSISSGRNDLVVSTVMAALKQIYAGRLDASRITPALRAKLTAARVKSLSASMKQYGAPNSPKLISLNQAGGHNVATIRVMLGATSYIVTAAIMADKRLDELQFIEE